MLYKSWTVGMLSIEQYDNRKTILRDICLVFIQKISCGGDIRWAYWLILSSSVFHALKAVQEISL